MPIVGEYTPPGAAAPAEKPCCLKCAAPALKQSLLRNGANLLGSALARAALGGLGDEEDEPLVWGPTTIEAYVQKTGTEIWSIAQDYSAAIRSGRITQATLSAFKAFFNEFEQWKAGLGFLSWLTYGTVSTAKSFRQRALQWRDKLVQSGATISAPAPNITVGPSQIPNVTKWVAGAAIAVAGAVALGHIAKATGVLRRA